MAMPGAVELHRHYDTEAEFQHDRDSLLSEGWTLEEFHSAASAGWRSWFNRRRHGIDAHYLRADMPVE